MSTKKSALFNPQFFNRLILDVLYWLQNNRLSIFVFSSRLKFAFTLCCESVNSYENHNNSNFVDELNSSANVDKSLMLKLLYIPV